VDADGVAVTSPEPARPIVSIVTPSFNQAEFLAATLRSVAMQDYPMIEHIIVDGGSTDGSVEILKAWSVQHPIRWSSARDAGQADAIQRGIEQANGQIVAWLNSDDIYLDSKVIEDVVALFGLGARVVSGGGWFIDHDGSRRKRIPVVARHLTHETLRHVDWVLQPATFVERQLLLAYPLDASLHYTFDWDLFIRLSAVVPFAVLPREIAGYRVHAGAKTVSGGVRRQRELLEIIRRYHGRRSRAYFLLAPIVGGHRFAALLPNPVGSTIAWVLSRLAMASLRVASGRGVQP
jgi:glycosyltransferase involved in cell wall biosynthesis